MPIEVCLTEDESVQLLWALLEAAATAQEVDALSTLALIEDAYAMARHRYDDRGGY